MNQNESGPGVTIPRPATSTISATQHDRDQRNRSMPVGVGIWHPPAGRRQLGVVIVDSCPMCRHLHLHRAMAVATADGCIRTGSCGAEYRLRVLPAQRVGGAA